MKATLIFIICLLHFTSSKAQEIGYDSLSSYSYLIFGSTVLNTNSKSKIPLGKQGTGFFVKVDSLIYFITSNHIINNNENSKSSGTDFIDSFNIYSHYSDPFNYLTIPANFISSLNKVNEGLKNADVFCYEVTNSIKKFKLQALKISDLNNDFEIGNTDFNKIRIFGFPENKNKIAGEVIQINPPYRFESNNFHIRENFLNQIGKDIGIDYLRYEIQIKDQKINSGLAGFSGSPVFIQNKSSLKWLFIGIIIAINELKNSIYVVKKDEIIREVLKIYDTRVSNKK